jgi:protocatechuate 3,4-dioxygenase alpha subunit
MPTPSQTLGPFFSIELPHDGWNELVPADAVDAVRIRGVVRDGAGEPVGDAMVELWQANRAGRYAHPEDARSDVELDEGFTGFGRCATGPGGEFEFVTVKPGPVAPQAPHIDVSVFARGLLKRVVTRIYFPDEEEANASDPVLGSVPAGLRSRLVARKDADHVLRFDVNLQGDEETPFFDV